MECENLKEFINAVDGHDLEFILQDDGFKFNNIAEFLGCKFDSLDNYQLELRTIGQLTDDEKKYIAKNFLLVDWGVLEGRTNQITLIHIMSWCEFEKLKDLLDYFREIGVDIDGMFVSGKAVKDV